MNILSDKYKLIRNIIAIICIICSACLCFIDYEDEYRCVIAMPIFYLIFSLTVFDRKMVGYGLCVITLFCFYTFRMCLQPVILAMGNFWLETNKSTYISYYPYAVLLTCIKCAIVMLSVKYFTRKYSSRNKSSISLDNIRRHKVFKFCVVWLTVIIFSIIAVFHIYYFYFFLDDMDTALLELRDEQLVRGTWYFIVDLLAGWWRPLLSFWLMYFFYYKYRDKAYTALILIALLNLAFTSDRRIFSIIVGGFCFYFMLSILKKKKLIRITQLFLLACVVGVIIVLFLGYSEQGGSIMIARTVNRYFSGPTLTAMCLQINDNISIEPEVFFAYLHNTFQTLTSLGGTWDVPDYYTRYYGMSKGLWIPCTVGALRYFGILFPVFLIWFSWFVVRMDYKSDGTSCVLYKMVYSYLGVVLSCYMIMYTLELIVYFLLSTVPLFLLLIKFDRQVRI